MKLPCTFTLGYNVLLLQRATVFAPRGNAVRRLVNAPACGLRQVQVEKVPRRPRPSGSRRYRAPGTAHCGAAAREGPASRSPKDGPSFMEAVDGGGTSRTTRERRIIVTVFDVCPCESSVKTTTTLSRAPDPHTSKFEQLLGRFNCRLTHLFVFAWCCGSTNCGFRAGVARREGEVFGPYMTVEPINSNSSKNNQFKIHDNGTRIDGARINKT